MLLEHPEETRAWADHHQDWASAAGAVVDALYAAFDTLAHIQYDAPWRSGDARDDTRH